MSQMRTLLVRMDVECYDGTCGKCIHRFLNNTNGKFYCRVFDCKDLEPQSDMTLRLPECEQSQINAREMKKILTMLSDSSDTIQDISKGLFPKENK